MKIADLYIRVSTDEQADKGYSQRSQEDVLRRYCEYNNIKVRNTVFEDHSAKTFIRPQWKNLLADLKKHKGKVDLLLFTKWDRFSRNASDAYYMISVLKKLGIEPVAIEQPLDTSVPENKMMLAVYLTAPETEWLHLFFIRKEPNLVLRRAVISQFIKLGNHLPNMHMRLQRLISNNSQS